MQNLTNGSDVTVFGTSERPAGAHLAALSSLADAAAAEPMQHRFAYVGADLQDLYGINPKRLQNATTLSDAYFSGTTLEMLDRLAATPEAALVSRRRFKTSSCRRVTPSSCGWSTPPTINTIQCHSSSSVSRGVSDCTRDSFIVANADYVARTTGSSAAEYVLMRSKGDPGRLAVEAKSAVSADPSVKVVEIGQAAQLIASSLTAIDLTGLTTIELAFGVVMAAAAAGLMLALGFAERRRNFAILAAIGAKQQQLAAFLWSEALLILLGGLGFGVISGLLMAWMLVKMLTGIFDPAPETLAIPLPYLVLMTSVFVASVIAAVIFAKRSARPQIEHLRDSSWKRRRPPAVHNAKTYQFVLFRKSHRKS